MGVVLSLLAVMRGDALEYGREVARMLLLANPSRYGGLVQSLSVSELPLLAWVLESADGIAPAPNAHEFVQQVQALALAAHQQVVGRFNDYIIT